MPARRGRMDRLARQGTHPGGKDSFERSRIRSAGGDRLMLRDVRSSMWAGYAWCMARDCTERRAFRSRSAIARPRLLLCGRCPQSGERRRSERSSRSSSCSRHGRDRGGPPLNPGIDIPNGARRGQREAQVWYAERDWQVQAAKILSIVGSRGSDITKPPTR